MGEAEPQFAPAAPRKEAIHEQCICPLGNLRHSLCRQVLPCDTTNEVMPSAVALISNIRAAVYSHSYYTAIGGENHTQTPTFPENLPEK
jgi:hypothetical protein